MMKNPIEMIKEEFCSRYGLQPEQVEIEIKLMSVEKERAEEIGKDYGTKYKGISSYHVGDHCTSIDNENFHLWVHYPKKEGENDELIIE